uniref:Bm76 n=1 Tax=Brugia malayi TaxID=6279 RepID=A0A0J9XL90_BRUMA|nr:Bm76 [Brugia malayi]
MRNTYLLTMVVFCMITMQLSAYHHRPYIISGWPIMIGDDDQVAIPDDAQISKMPEPIQKTISSWMEYSSKSTEESIKKKQTTITMTPITSTINNNNNYNNK